MLKDNNKAEELETTSLFINKLHLISSWKSVTLIHKRSSNRPVSFRCTAWEDYVYGAAVLCSRMYLGCSGITAYILEKRYVKKINPQVSGTWTPMLNQCQKGRTVFSRLLP